jgi:hypothetical protein
MAGFQMFFFVETIVSSQEALMNLLEDDWDQYPSKNSTSQLGSSCCLIWHHMSSGWDTEKFTVYDDCKLS